MDSKLAHIPEQVAHLDDGVFSNLVIWSQRIGQTALAHAPLDRLIGEIEMTRKRLPARPNIEHRLAGFALQLRGTLDAGGYKCESVFESVHDCPGACSP